MKHQVKITAEHKEARKAAWAGWVGSALEYYDFFLYSTAAALVLGPIFFPAQEKSLGTLAAIASVGVGFISRPFGALILGPIGDLYGRRFVLSLTLIIMGGSTFLIGLLPSYEKIGIAAPITLIVLRLLQGLAAAGEHAGSSTLALELAGNSRRAFYTSFTLSGTLAGLISASLAFLLLTSILPEKDLLNWGWRIPFLFSALVVVMGIWVRCRLPESPSFRFSNTRQISHSHPLRTILTQHKRTVAKIVIAAQVSSVSAIMGVYAISWAVNDLHIPRPIMLTAQLASAFVAMFATPIWARLSDQMGRKPVFMGGAIVSGCLIWPFLWAINTQSSALIFTVFLCLGGISYSASNAVWPALFGEMFPREIRLSGLAISTQTGFTIAAQMPAIAIALTTYVFADWPIVALAISICCGASTLAVFGTRETNKVSMNELDNRSIHEEN